MNRHDLTEMNMLKSVKIILVSCKNRHTKALIILGPPQMKKQKDADTVKLVYDYDSVMHYSRWQCAASYPDSPSMTYTKYIHNPDYVGQRRKLSSTDIQHIKAIHCSS